MNGENRRFRILNVTNSRNKSGGTRQAVLLARELMSRGHHVTFCAPADSWALARAGDVGIDVRPVSFATRWDTWRASRLLRKLALEIRADVVHTHHTKAHNAALLATFGEGFPPVLANRGVLFRPDLPAKFRSPRTRAIITNSTAVKQVLISCRIPAGKIHVIYNARELPGLDRLSEQAEEIGREIGLRKNGPIIGTVGNGTPAKGFQHLVDAAPFILERFPGAQFVLVGSSTERFLPRMRALGVDNACLLTGYREDAQALMGLFDVFVLPSVDMESCPNVLLEAMSARVPVVTSDIGDAGAIVRSAECGKVVRPGDVEQLAAGVMDVLGDVRLAQDLGESGRRAIAEGFTLQAKVDATLAVYNRITK